ncbi:MAG: hypothetical protein K5662_04635 [Lachnospiraceae bacterium]|nr:hypothetical protein [Lachnospiraceae bacterium]
MKKRNESTIMFVQDCGMLLFLTSIICGVILILFSSETYAYQNILMLFLQFLVGILVIFRVRTIATIAAAFEILLFAAYKLYMYFSEAHIIEVTAYIWPFLILGCLAGTTMFIQTIAQLEEINHLLNRQVDELTIVEPVTGLNNLKAFYTELERIMALSVRHNTEFGVMIVRLRYVAELKKIMSTSDFNKIRQRIAVIVEDVLRIEDYAYAMDEDGSVGIIYFANEAGARVLRKRLIERLTDREEYDPVGGEHIRMDFRIANKQYVNELEKDPINYIRVVEGEMAYDV